MNSSAHKEDKKKNLAHKNKTIEVTSNKTSTSHIRNDIVPIPPQISTYKTEKQRNDERDQKQTCGALWLIHPPRLTYRCIIAPSWGNL